MQQCCTHVNIHTGTYNGADAVPTINEHIVAMSKEGWRLVSTNTEVNSLFLFWRYE